MSAIRAEKRPALGQWKRYRERLPTEAELTIGSPTGRTLSASSKELQSANYDLALLGFEDKELARMLESEIVNGLTDPDEVPEPPDDPITQPGENVLDLFGGSGSTLIGAEQIGRHAYLMEIDPPYCDVIVTRRSSSGCAESRRAASRSRVRPL